MQIYYDLKTIPSVSHRLSTIFLKDKFDLKFVTGGKNRTKPSIPLFQIVLQHANIRCPSLWCSIAVLIQHEKLKPFGCSRLHQKSSSNKDLPRKFSILDLIDRIFSFNWEALSSSSLSRALVLATCFLAMATSFSLRERSSI
jgi:hypothetical protein